MRKWSRSREMVFGHSIRRAAHWKDFLPPVTLKILMGLNGSYWSYAAEKEGTCQAFMSPVMLLGGQPKRHLRPSRSKCIFTKEKKNHWKSSQAPIAFPVSWVPSLALTLKQLMGMGAGPTPKDRKESPKQLYFSKGPGCRYHGTNASGHHTTVYTTVGRWSQIVGKNVARGWQW